MSFRHPLATVLVASIVCLAVGFSATPFWDEDEPRFASIARTMYETGDWVVPMYNGAVSIDKPALMNWCMAISFAIFGTNEFGARVPSAVATLLTALALLRAGSRWFDATTGTIAALAFVGCLLVGIESHAATPDAILVAITTWSTILAVEPFLPDSRRTASNAGRHVGQDVTLPMIGARRAAAVGGLLGLGVLCKGPIGFIGPIAVVLSWTGLLAARRRLAATDRKTPLIRRLLVSMVAAAFEAMQAVRLGTLVLAAVAVAAPWYTAVGIRTGGSWPLGFFMVHNVGRFVAPMEKHSGGPLYHCLMMLVGFYPWSCFLPLAIVVAAARVWKRSGSPALSDTLLLSLLWLVVWLGGFSAAATKLPNYVLPAYPAAALLVAALGVDAARRTHWPCPRWLASGLGWLAFGGVATAATVLVGTQFGLTGAEPAAVAGLVPIVGAIACAWWARRDHMTAVHVFTATALIYTGIMVGPVGARIATANLLPGLIDQAHGHAGGTARLATLGFLTPNVVYYSRGVVRDLEVMPRAEAAAFLRSGPDALVLVREDKFADLEPHLPSHVGVVARARPLFSRLDFLLLGSQPDAEPHTAAKETTRR